MRPDPALGIRPRGLIDPAELVAHAARGLGRAPRFSALVAWGLPRGDRAADLRYRPNGFAVRLVERGRPLAIFAARLPRIPARLLDNAARHLGHAAQLLSIAALRSKIPVRSRKKVSHRTTPAPRLLGIAPRPAEIAPWAVTKPAAGFLFETVRCKDRDGLVDVDQSFELN